MTRIFATTLIWGICGVVCGCSPEMMSAPEDGGSDGSEALLPVPFVPPIPGSPFIDAPYLQETNHTSNEVEAGIGPLVSVVLPPSSYVGFDRPTQVTARGFVRHAMGKPVLTTIDALGPNLPDLIAAAATRSGIVMASPQFLYLVAGDGTLTSFAAPAGSAITSLAATRDAVYVLTDHGLGRLLPQAGNSPDWATGGPVATAAVESNGHLFLGGADFVSSWPIPQGATLGVAEWTLHASDGITALPVAALVGAVTLPAALDLVVIGAGDKGIQGLTVSAAKSTIANVPEFAANRVPLVDPRTAMATSDGGFLVGTKAAACRIMDRGHGREWRVYNQERWLPSEEVRGIATDVTVADGPIWFATAGGLATVTAQRMTLENKLASFVDRVVKRHDRDGAVADSRLTRKGDLTTNIPYDSDNDGGWTAYWLLGECFRYAATKAPDAKAHFDEALDAMLRLRDETGTDYFVARSVIRKDGCMLDDCDNPDDGAWFTSPDGKWWVKRDTSNDEVDSHIFMMGPSYDLCADESQKKRIAAHIAGIVGGIMDHGWQLIDPVTGKVTTYGQFDPDYVTVNLAGKFGDGGVRSATILGGLTLAHYMTGEQRFLDGKNLLISQYHYDDEAQRMWDHVINQGQGDANELGTQAWFPLLRYETDSALRAKWLDGWTRLWKHALAPQQASFWGMVNSMAGNGDTDLGLVGRWLRLAPVDMIRWDQHNSQRRDLMPPPAPYDGESGAAIRSDGFLLPYDERPTDRWNTHQFRVDGGMGGSLEMDGADVLAPYWMGRYFGFIKPAQ